MPRDVEDLIAVQVLDIRILKLEQELRDIPDRKHQISQRNNALKESLESEKDSSRSARARAAELELEARSEREKIAKLRTQQMQLKSNKEFKVMADEIALVERHAASFDDKQIEALEQVEQVEQRVRDVENNLNSADGEMQLSVQELDARIRDIEAEQTLKPGGKDKEGREQD